MADHPVCIQTSTLADIADAVRGLTHESDPLTPAQMAEAIGAQRLGQPFEGCGEGHVANGRWVRPEGWPDLDALKAAIPDGESVVYLTYVLDRAPDQAWVGMYASGGTWYAERGHVEGGAFVADASTSHSSAQYHREELDPANGNVQLWRMRSTAKITRFGLASRTGTNASNPATMTQPCVEKAGRLPYATNLSSGTTTFNTVAYSSLAQATYHLERDSVDYEGAVTSIAYMYYLATSLQEVDASGWKAENWKVTALTHCFNGCYSLRSLDLSGLDVSAWRPTSLAGLFANCYSLTRLDVSGWDVSAWRPTTIDSLLSGCRSLRRVPCLGWDVSAWPVNVVSNAFNGMWSLETLDLSRWDTSSWPVAGSAQAMVYNCYCLRDVTLPDTSGWSPTTSRYLFEGCPALRRVPRVDLHEVDSCAYYGVPNGGYLLADYGGRARIKVTHNYRNCVLLTHESLLAIIDALPEVSTSVQLQLGPTNLLKLTDEERAVATAKGWTVVS